MPSLAIYSQVLGLRKAKHLLRRTTFNYTKKTIDEFAVLTASEALTKLSQKATSGLSRPYDPEPTDAPDGDWVQSSELPNSFSGQGRKRIAITSWWWYNAYNQSTLQHKLTFFLHTSFTASKDAGIGGATYFYDHLRLLDFYSMGNIKELAKKITLDNGMLNYLDNNLNNAKNPNENYAREFLELFTILKGTQVADGNYTNYTELDVQMAAKVFSGYKIQSDRSKKDKITKLPIGYTDVSKHDITDKKFSTAFNEQVIIGKDTDAGMIEELDDFVEMIFAQKATAISYVRKLYRFFVKSEWETSVETDIIEPLAQLLIDNNYEILPVVSKLLTSQHFFDMDDNDSSDNIIGSIIKSPMQLFTEMCSLFQVDIPNPNPNKTEVLDYYQRFSRWFVHNAVYAGAGFNFFSPDTVAGYPAHYQAPHFDRHWFTSTTIITRYQIISSLILGKNITTGGKTSIGVTLDTITFVKNNISMPLDSTVLVTELSELLYPESIDDDRITYFKENLLDGYEDYYWSKTWQDYLNSGDDTSVKNRLDELVIAMVNAPEFQVM